MSDFANGQLGDVRPSPGAARRCAAPGSRDAADRRPGWTRRSARRASGDVCETAHPNSGRDPTAGDSPWTAAMQTVMQDALALRTRCTPGGIGVHGLAPAHGRLEARLGRLIRRPAAAGRRRALRPREPVSRIDNPGSKV